MPQALGSALIGSRYRDTVIINTKDSQTLKGVYWGGGSRVVRLREAFLIENGQPIKVDGEVVVERRNVSFYQRLIRVE